ncbi:hypothetical protein RN001_007999 [Aquatica leii]|uniref:DNA mismatch repair proteins mutS family domain-containing protein n=1 Tax=Aquatica leii TaxID=1421715 RepID=A0AAN7SP34_9COLE|nr:hypothetical protein RN001_007999 [Aquatica leii]
MNMNDSLYGRGRGRGRGRSMKVVPIQGALNRIPKQPTRKTKTNSSPFTASSSHVNWKSCSNSTKRINSGCNTGMSTWTRSSTESESHIIVALSEGRGEAICEVGIAAINISHSTLILCQISDTQSYVNTLTKINIFNPTEILIPMTFVESFTTNRLFEKVKAQFNNVKITGVNRSTFSRNLGMQYVKQLCVTNMNSVLLVLQHRYYALAAAAALLSYAETNLYVIYAKESIKIEYQESEGYAIIDVATADRLELVASARPTIKRKYTCLFDILNYCYTKVGKLSLRASILQPPCLVPDIEARLECVTELLEHGELLTDIKIALQKLTKIDQLLTLATVLPDHAQNCSDRQLNYLLLLNSILEQIPCLQEIFQNCNQPFFAELKATLNNPAFTEIKDILRTLINTDAHPAKGKYGTIQRCFAIKSGVNHLLDLVRKSYSERLDEAREYVKELGEKYSLSLTLNNTQQKGYHIVLTLNAHQKKTLKKCDLPDEFIQVDRLSSTFTMKTQTLIDLSSRIENINMEILKMSNIMIHKLLIAIRKHVGVFYLLCENISKLDMIQALAQASSNINYVRPKFANYLEILQGKHPLLNFLYCVEPSGNSVFASEEYNMNIITGPNGSGKSIFIRQIVLLQIMAQVGCYVPAESATFRVADRILARVYLEDNMTCGASAFALEMKEIQYFLTVLTKNTVIIVDELCRSTSTVEGTAIAMSICIKLLETPAFVFFTTHFKLLTILYDIYINVKLWQMETLTEIINEKIILRFQYNVIPGVTSLEHYGIFLAKSSWPDNLIECAQKVLEQLSLLQKPRLDRKKIHPAVRLKYDLESKFKLLKMKGKLTRQVINELTNEYTEQLKQLDTNFIQNVNIFQTSNKLDYINTTGNICDYYNTEKANTSYQDLSQNLSVIIQEKIKNFGEFTRELQQDENIIRDINIVAEPQLSFQEMEYESVDEKDFISNDLDYSYNSMFEPEIMIKTGDKNLSFTMNDSIHEPEQLFIGTNTNVFSRDFNKTIHNTSCDSINQIKFSLPLQHHIERTSTPVAVNFNQTLFDQSQIIATKSTEQANKFIVHSDTKHDENMKSLNRTGSNAFTFDNFNPNMVQNLSLQQEAFSNQCENFTVIQNERQSKKSTTITTSSSTKWLEKQNQSWKEAVHIYPNLQKNKMECTKINNNNIQNHKDLTSHQNSCNRNNSSFESMWKNGHKTSLCETKLTESSCTETSICEELYRNTISSNLNQFKGMEEAKGEPRHQHSTGSEKWLESNNSRMNKVTKTSSLTITENPLSINQSNDTFTQSHLSDAEIAEITNEVQHWSEEDFTGLDDWINKDIHETKNSSDVSKDFSLHTGCGGYQITVHAEIHPVNSPKLNSVLPNIAVSDREIQMCTEICTQETNTSDNVLSMPTPKVDRINHPETNETTEKLSVCENAQQSNLYLFQTDNRELLSRSNHIDSERTCHVSNKCNLVDEQKILNPEELNSNILSSSNKLVTFSYDNNGVKSDIVNNTSLEPLGDIHLELFSDESTCELTNPGAGNIQGNDATTTDYETAKSGTQTSCDLFLTPATPPKLKKTKTCFEYSTMLDNVDTKKTNKKSTAVLTPKKIKWTPPYKRPLKDIDLFKKELSGSASVKELPSSHIEPMHFEENFYDNIENRLKSIINRPTVKQLRKSECLVSFRKTEHGVVEVPVQKKKFKSKKKKFVSPMLQRTSEEFDVTLLTNKNVQKFENYMNSSKKSSPLVRIETSCFQFTRSEVASRQTEITLSTDNENVFTNSEKNIQDFKNKLLQKFQDTSTVNSQDLSQYQENANPGYYTQNKEEIDNLVNKYRNIDDVDEEIISNSQNRFQNESFNSSIFSQSTR